MWKAGAAQLKIIKLNWFNKHLSLEMLQQHVCLTAPLFLTAVLAEALRVEAILNAKTNQLNDGN